MPRPNEIAADAHALYGPAAVRPAASAMGDGALWVDPGDNQAVWQVQSGNWQRIALPPTDDDSSIPADDDSSIPAGVPVLRGPYVVDYTDLPHHGDTLTLWVPQVGDVLLRLFPDWQTVVQWTAGQFVGIGQGIDVTANPALNVLAYADGGTIGRGPGEGLDNIIDAVGSDATDASGANWLSSAYVFATAAPVQMQYGSPGPGHADGTQGHVELFALIARPVAP